VLDALKAGTLTNEQLASLPFLDCFIKETQRLWPTAAIATSRVVQGPRDATVGGVRVPPGTVVWVECSRPHSHSYLPLL
jgi:cytochrome P450